MIYIVIYCRYLLKVLKGQQPVATNSAFSYLLEEHRSCPKSFSNPPTLDELVECYSAVAQK